MPFIWSEANQRYYYPSGRPVPPGRVNAALERVIQQGANNMRDVTVQLQNGTITLATWQARMADEMKMLHTGAAAFGRGGWAQMTFSDWGWTGSVLRAQYGYLRQFATDIATGHAPMDGRLVARAAMYAEAARATQRNMQRRLAQFFGKAQERNVLGAADRHCAACISCSAAGWVPVGTLPAIGTRTCLSRCHCTMQYRDVPMMEAA